MLFLPAFLLGLATGPAVGEAWRPPELMVRPPPPLNDADALKAIAFRFLGAPYQMGGIGSPGIDCSAFVCRVYAEAGYALPRVSRDQVRAGRAVAISAIQPGDLLFFADPGAPISHVGLYLGQNELIHASTGQGEVVVADLSARWFQERLVAARRVLTSSTATVSAPPPARTMELVEHRGDTRLLPMLRRPPRRPEPSYGPELAGAGVTSLGVRGAVITEAGKLGFTLAPEATIFVESWALTLAAAFPIRFAVDERPTLGPFERKGDVLKFLRTATLGLPGADLYLSASRLADLSLGDRLVRHLLPAAAVRGVSGLTTQRSPLSLSAGVRAFEVTTELILDDVVDPGLLGVAAETQLLGGLLRPAWSYASDQRGLWQGARRTISATALGLSVVPIEDARWTLALSARGNLQAALAETGAIGTAAASLQRRFGARNLFGFELYGEALSSHALAGLYGPTYVAYRSEHLAAWADSGARYGLGAEAHLALGKLRVSGGYARGLGAEQRPIDERLEALVAIEGLPIGGNRLLDLRGVYAARAPFAGGPVLDYLQASLRVRLSSWLFLEGYLGKGESLEGGGGATIAFIP